MSKKLTALAASLVMIAAAPPAMSADIPQGSIKGKAWVQTDRTMAEAMAQSWTVLPATVTGDKLYEGTNIGAPETKGKAPAVIFVHGSGGINPHIKAFQKRLAEELGIASFTPDSFQLPDRMTYSSPIDPMDYEKIHALRASELSAAVEFLTKQPWFNGRFVIAGTSEGAVAVARYVRAEHAPAEAGRIIFSWSCENNYHVVQHKTRIPANMPVLNIMSSNDKYFSKANSYLGNPDAVGNCSKALEGNPNARIVLIKDAPHTLMNEPQAREAEDRFLKDVLLK